MSEVPVCRVCLMDNVRMELIQSPRLQEVFEILANNKLVTDDGRPKTVCYICFSQLRKCQRFMQVSRRAESILTQLYQNGSKVTEESVKLLNGGTQLNISMPTLQPMEFYDFPSELEYSLKGCVKQEHYLDFNLHEDLHENVTLVPVEFVKAPNSSEIKKETMDSTSDDLMNSNNHVKKEQLSTDQSSCRNYTGQENIHNVEMSFNCTICGNSYANTYVFKQHMKTHSRGKTYSCQMCCKSFTKNNYLIKHMTTHSVEESFACSVCNKIFSEKSKWKKHLKLHTENGFACGPRDKVIPEIQLEPHNSKTDARVRPFACEVCSKRFAFKSKLERHIRSHTDERPYACKLCDKAFAETGNLKNHIRVHTGEKPYSCDSCGKGFAKSTTLKEHLRIHSIEKQFTCGVCNRGFTSKNNLTIHIRTHSGEKPYVCSICKKGFAQSNSLKKHFTTHTGEKQFSCVICYKSFATKNGWKIHMRVHSGEKPYTCNVCSKSFIDISTLNRHKRIHTGEKPHICIECKKSFSRKAYLLKHVTFCKRCP